jgi:hypothetical protein
MSSELRITIPLLKVLDAMLQAPDQNHWGFEIMKRTGLKSGTLYPLLARLDRPRSATAPVLPAHWGRRRVSARRVGEAAWPRL